MEQYTVFESAGFQTVCVELTSGTVERRVVISVTSSNADALGKHTTIVIQYVILSVISDVQNIRLLFKRLCELVAIGYAWHMYSFLES
jgi:hypothetical protein